MKKADKELLENLKENIEKLNPYEKYFSQAIHNFIRITPEGTRKLLEAYHGPDYRNKVKPSVFSCALCKMNAIKSIAIEYYGMIKTVQDLEALQAKEAERKNKAKENATK